MTAYHYYTIAAAVYGAYALGLMHGKGRTHWMNFVAAIIFGSAWPIAVVYGVYVVHFERT